MIDTILTNNGELAVVFADVAGSTQLFEKIGDTAAKKKIDECISIMMQIIEMNHGTIVKTIGDEVMCRFGTVDHAASAAVGIQQHIEELALTDRAQLKVRIGMHYGPSIVEADDLFGDAVNIAARMASIAKAGEIIVTDHFAAKISAHIGIQTRPFDQLRVKGKREEMIVHAILWEEKSLTIMRSPDVKNFGRAEKLILRYLGIEKHISNSTTGFTLGRGDDTDLRVNSSIVSRTHAVIDYNRGKFILKDQSTNGTYVQDESRNDLYLRREELPLLVRGFISLGSPVACNSDHLIEFISA